MKLIFDKNIFDPQCNRLAFFLVLLFRIAFFILLIFVIDSLVKPGTNPLLLGIGTTIGVIVASRLAFSKLRSLSFWLLIFLCWLALFWIEGLLELSKNSSGDVFGSFVFFSHAKVFLLYLSIAALTTWYFWRFSQILTLEALCFVFIIVTLLSAHRNYHFDAPLIINTLSWNLSLEQLKLLIWIGLLAVTALLMYFYCATLPERPIANETHTKMFVHRSSRWFFSALTTIIAGIFLFFVIGRGVYGFYNKVALTRIANGVGQESREGLSPLGFHSALGTTNQPAALVRLEGDYKENPFTPMLYLRETALSQFNGKELVIAPHEFDKDVSNISPGYEYAREEDHELQERKALVQSIYLLADHKEAFAIDYPISLKQLKNPNVKRFRLAYQATSLVPTFSLDKLSDATVGDPRWSIKESDLYLQEHPDPRYKEFALKIAGHLLSPIEKARAISAWFSKNATYTLTPNHNISPDDDPVAPFLFGDLRGYCVHFAHAMVYLFRSLGIPARIGTGYLTDLSQSKDGHILLRMSDRHAWSEIYIQGKGWIPFDVQPEKVESHAETPVDSKLLEELMQMLEPGELILPKDILKGEASSDEGNLINITLPSKRQLLIGVIGLLSVLLFLKVFLIYGWLLPSSPEKTLKRLYRSIIARLMDLGYFRTEGETREEFSRRIAGTSEINFTALTDKLNLLVYSKDGLKGTEKNELVKNGMESLNSLKKVKFLIRLLSFLNPNSLIRFLSRGGW
ncbi:MAG: transglutaminase domain-containing protein [SAR324 cluster bacterium]|uniref:Transglutaminase domain-containing protein n=1 Tax=SAR324 cluster bacterium TaxID=2024889 RepID=A0A7X9FSP3_9DELT|nr:transglutaminase domain-containing protein [SAR324 cluster bacterium]